MNITRGKKGAVTQSKSALVRASFPAAVTKLSTQVRCQNRQNMENTGPCVRYVRCVERVDWKFADLLRWSHFWLSACANV